MKRTRRNSGFTIVEMATVVGIIAVLAALSYAALEVLPQRTRLTGGALEFAAVISSARSHAYGRNQRVAVILNADGPSLGEPIRYWVVVDPWSSITKTLETHSDWRSLKDLVPEAPAPSGAEYTVFDSGNFNATVRVLDMGFADAVGRVKHKGCSDALIDRIGLAKGPSTAASGVSYTFPPPFCSVPNDVACTFCSGDGTPANPLRGVILFEPDGSVTFANAKGVASKAGSASLTLRATGSGGTDSAQAIVMTNTGLVRTFSANSSR
ncbi:pilus assembly FimT family protein [Archangium primigenium]|uniref:pilus assembly FimT family protein n=1 Tax=[Archangium] primigenium TaxID=2792470 RepID=UPI00195646F2|nr:prepilin-type N-terminal cleavage/methylation domain-containing protein [Archangium primigenium]MBM7118925.1 prepilin-type N-terminal cleavage/methylation domain-containing protein [Archangium primigenium]